MFSLIDRWLLKEVAKTLLVILAVLTSVLLASLLVRLLGMVASGVLGNEVLATLVGLELLKLLSSLVPPAFFFSILWVLGRLYQDGEMLALHAAGVGTARIYRAFMYSAIPLALLVAWLSLEVLPWAKLAGQRVKAEDRAKSELAAVRPGEFSEFAGGKLVFFAERNGINGELRGLFIQERMQQQPGVVSASSAAQVLDPASGARYLVLVNGRRYQGLQGEGELAIAEFDEYGILLPEPERVDAALPINGRDWRELWASDDPVFKAELQDRLSLPLAVLAFTLVAVPLARSMPRQGIYGRMAMAVVVYLVFMNLQRLAEQWMANGSTPLWLGMWWVPACLALVAAAVLWFDSPGWRVRRRRRRAAV